jgi:twitching motility protein PilT
VLSPEQRAGFDEAQELDFAFTLSANARFRVNFYVQRGAIGGPSASSHRDQAARTAGVPDIVGEFSKLPRGLVLVTGPTGSGKSTTLAALVDLVNATRSDHIVTVEDPIEFLHSNKRSLVNQREVGHDTHSFANALEARAAAGPGRHPDR